MDTLKELNIPKEDCVIYGSAPMVLRGLKEKNNDLDVLVKDSLWEKLSVKYPNNKFAKILMWIYIVLIILVYRDNNFWDPYFGKYY